MTIEIWDQDKLKNDELIGTASLNIESALPVCPLNNAHPLTRTNPLTALRNNDVIIKHDDQK